MSYQLIQTPVFLKRPGQARYAHSDLMIMLSLRNFIMI